MTFYKRVTLFSIIGCQQMLIFFTTSMAWSEVHTLLVRHLNSLGICTSHSVFSLAKKHKEKKMFGVFSVIKVKWRDSKYYRACLIIDELTRLKPFCRLCVLLPSDCHRTNELCGWITAVMTKLQVNEPPSKHLFGCRELVTVNESGICVRQRYHTRQLIGSACWRLLLSTGNCNCLVEVLMGDLMCVIS